MLKAVGFIALIACAWLATTALAVGIDRDRAQVHDQRRRHRMSRAGAGAVAHRGHARVHAFPNCNTHLPTRTEWYGALVKGQRTRHEEYQQIWTLLPVAPANPNPTPDTYVAVAQRLMQLVDMFAHRTANNGKALPPLPVRNAYADMKACATQFQAHHLANTLTPIMAGANPEHLITTYRTSIDGYAAPAIGTAAYPAVTSFVYDQQVGYLAPCVGACLPAGTLTRNEGSRLNVRVVTTHAAHNIAGGGGAGPHSPFRWGLWDTKFDAHHVSMGLASLPFVVYNTAHAPAQVPTTPVAAQYLTYEQRECHVMQLDAGEAANVFTAEMSGCNAYVLRDANDAQEPIFIHCNGNAIASSAYASAPDNTPGVAGEMAKAMTADLIFAKYVRHGFVRHVSHRRFPHYGHTPHRGGQVLATDPNVGGVATWAHRTGVAHVYDWFATYVGATAQRPMKKVVRPAVGGGKSVTWEYNEVAAPAFTHIQLLPNAAGGGVAPDHAWPAVPNRFGAFNCHERPPTQAEYTNVCGVHCSPYVTGRLPVAAPAPNAWWQAPLGAAGAVPNGGWGGAAPTQTEADGITGILKFVHTGMTGGTTQPWGEAKRAFYDELRHCLAMLVTAAHNG